MARRFGENNPAAKVQDIWPTRAKEIHKADSNQGPARIRAKFLQEGMDIPQGTIKGWLYENQRARA